MVGLIILAVIIGLLIVYFTYNSLNTGYGSVPTKMYGGAKFLFESFMKRKKNKKHKK